MTGGTLLVVGTGLIGGSFALGAREAGCFERIIGVDTNGNALTGARQLNIIDEAADGLAAGVAAADAVFVAVPTAAAATVLASVFRARTDADFVVFDGASVKVPVIESLRKSLGALPANYLPVHPRAGSERHGPDAATGRLFSGCRVFLTPEPETSSSTVFQVAGYWRALGADIQVTDAQHHDEQASRISHVPHLLAYAYMSWAGERSGRAPGLGDYAGPGFRDFTRIAASDAALWREIIEANAGQVLAQLDEFQQVLSRYRSLLADGRFAELEKELIIARDARSRMLGSETQASRRTAAHAEERPPKEQDDE